MKVRNAGHILEEAANTFKEKNAEYGDNYKRVGGMFDALFPDGIELNDEDDFNRFHILMLLIVKITRYAVNWKEGHQDSIRDAAVYCAMLESIDDGIKDLDKFEDSIEAQVNLIDKQERVQESAREQGRLLRKSNRTERTCK